MLTLLRKIAPVLVCAVALCVAFAELWSTDGGRTHVPTRADLLGTRFEPTTRADVTYETWLVARHARTLLTRPLALFDTEHCAPLEKSLTLSIPMVTMGILGIPTMLVTGDAVLTYNAVLTLMTALAALAMYLLVSYWTGSPMAATVAAILYAFHPMRLSHINHPSVWDMTWTVFALYFSHRLFAEGRWRDAIGLSVACALQIGASIYPLVAAAFLSPPYVGWLVWRYRFDRVSASQLLAVAASVALAVAVVLVPYLQARAGNEELSRGFFYYLPLGAYFRTGYFWLGWTTVALAVVALVFGRYGLLRTERGDPRWVLLMGAFMVAVIAAGDSINGTFRSLWGGAPWRMPNFHAELATVLPGLDAIRAIKRLSAAVHLVACALAGIGVAAVIRLGGRYSRLVAGLVLVVALVDMLRPFGMPRSYAWALVEVAPGTEAVNLAWRLHDAEDPGAIFEIPFDGTFPLQIAVSPARIFMTLQHGRRTSACFGSYATPMRDDLVDIARRVPRASALAELHELGFTTLVVHGDPDATPFWNKLAAAAINQAEPTLRMIHTSPNARIYDIVTRLGDSGDVDVQLPGGRETGGDR